MKKITRDELVLLTGLTEGAIIGLYAAKGIPSSGGLDLHETLALVIGGRLKRHKLPYSKIVPVVRHVWELGSREALEARLENGHKFVLCVGEIAVPRLLDVAACQEPGGVGIEAFEKMIGAKARVLDVKVLWDAMLRSLAQLRSEQDDVKDRKETKRRIEA